MMRLVEILEVAEIHKDRILFAYNEIQSSLPFTAEYVAGIKSHDIPMIELLTNRFAKMQDIMGTKLIPAFLELKGELIDRDTLIDRVNKLERLEIIDDARTWMQMREVRSHLVHEYPNHPEITARYLNELCDFIPELLKIFDNIKSRI